MKLAPLLAQYLYANRRLDLPGIGTFSLDQPLPSDTDTAKTTHFEGIHFEKNTSIKESNDLVAFISAQTGKMKALAAADLSSHLELIQQFLNIGKPFLLEGIGSLVKISSGQFEFTSGQIMPEKIKEFSLKEISATSSTEESFTDYQNVFNPPKNKIKWRRPVMILLIIAGLGLGVWGGYTLSKRSRNKEDDSTTRTEEKQEVKQEETRILGDSVLNQNDSAVIPVQPVASQTPPGNFKFVVETANKERGLQRYLALKSWGLKVNMETLDSSSFKIFFLLPASSADTTRIKDSLGNLYTPAWSKAFVDNSN